MAGITGTLNTAKNRFAQTLADTPAFRVWTGATDTAQGLGRIHLGGRAPKLAVDGVMSDHELYELRPCVLVETESRNVEWDSSGTDGSSGYVGGGVLVARMEAAVPPEILKDLGEAVERFEETMGLIFDGLLAIAGTNRAADDFSYLSIAEMEVSGTDLADIKMARAAGGLIAWMDWTITWTGQ